ncbi:MAG: hypothetical protein WKG06_19680 [Segetibacter sp.]
MERNYTSFEKLDTILNLFDFDDEIGGIPFHKVLKSPSHSMGHKATQSILFKLEKDDYLRTVIFDNDVLGVGVPPEKYYYLTIEGSILKDTGGYVQKEKERLMELFAMEQEKQLRKRNDKRLIAATWGAAIGATLIVIWDIIKTFCFTNH